MEWRPVLGFEGLYEVSDSGLVRSLDRFCPCKGGATRMHKGKMRKPAPKKHGYLQVSLSRNGKYTYLLVHQVVLRAFVGLEPDGHEARHLNGIKTDCRLSNLEWGTKVQNMADQYRHGTRIMGDKHHSSSLTEELVGWIRESSQSGTEIARLLSVDITTVCRARRGATYAHVG